MGKCKQLLVLGFFFFSTDALLVLLCFMYICSLSNVKFYGILSFFMNTECKSSFIKKTPNQLFYRSFTLEVLLAYLSLFIKLILPLQHNYLLRC